MKSTTATFKQIMASGNAREYLLKIYLTLADDTELTLTEQDIWEDSFSISTASSGTSSFDIGTAVVGKCTFTINNIEGDFDNYDFFNAEAVVWVGLKGDVNNDTQQYYRMGFYTVDEPQKANGLISLELLDNMWKFDVPFSDVTLNYPVTARNAVLAICSYCGVNLNTNQFHGYNFSIASAPEDVDNMNCREFLQYVAMIGCNFCCINDSGTLDIKWYDVDATAAETDVFDRNKSTSFGTDEIEITGIKFVIDDTAHTIGNEGYVLELENPLVTESNVNSVLNLIWDVLEDFTLRTFNITTISDLAAEIGDKCKIKDYKGNYVYSWITNNSFKFAGQQLSCNAESPQRTLVKRYSKTVQAAVAEARKITNQIISNYDLDVQELNKLVEQSMGAYTDYEEAPTGGRIYYVSNLPITKDASGHCVFANGSIVWRMAGDVFSVSTDGGQTWQNGYNPQTGKLIVNVLSTIGIQFDWARGGTLTLGGYGNGNGVLSILNSSNVEKVHGDNTGLKVGGTTGSKLALTTNGELSYYYDNAYAGQLKMDYVNYGDSSNPDYRDSFEVKEFDNVRIIADQELRLASDDDLSLYSSSGDVNVTSDDEIRIDAPSVSIGRADIGGNPTVVDIWNPNISGTQLTVGNDTAIGGTVYVVDSGGKVRNLRYSKGILVEETTTNTQKLDFWHKVNGVVIIGVLGVGVTSFTFDNLESADYAYEPYITCASGVDAPMLEGMSFNGLSCTIKFTAVTAAQAGSGQTSQCQVKLRVLV